MACQTLVFCSREDAATSSSPEAKAEIQRKIEKASSVDNGDMMLGNPSKANQNDYDNYLLGKDNYTLSYNNKKEHLTGQVGI
ncbi:hypothetical protein JJC03_07840 [Flavobacterium oreochromis]|uniref:hypothetical protein n=1 Tax=Flavobacterium oreochromis TaxID=2906078 RepID=UPI001CE653D3|nr:hypothetical protein [Flavobacterium oreochromis]QYS87685.1 hypothetical protein JJC03_07840 [Flavobacterium oreochromis]